MRAFRALSADGATHYTMDPERMKWMAGQVKRGRYLHCPDGSHLSQYDDPDHFFPGLVEFIRDVDGKPGSEFTG